MVSYADLLHLATQAADAAYNLPATHVHLDVDAMDVDGDYAQVQEIIQQGRSQWMYEDMEVDAPGDSTEALPPPDNKTLLAVLDTNILIHHAELLRDLIDFLRSLPLSAGPACVLLIPRMVLHELDKLKTADRLVDRPLPPADSAASSSSRHSSANRVPRSRSRVALSGLVRSVTSWLVEQMQDKKFIRGQRKEETGISPQARPPPDDYVLDAATFWRPHHPDVVLVTGDKILSAKALSEDLRVVSPRPAADLRSFLFQLHPDLLQSYLGRTDHTSFKRSLSAQPARITPAPTVTTIRTPVSGAPDPSRGESEEQSMIIDVDHLGNGTTPQRSTSPMTPLSIESYTSVARVYVETQAILAQLVIIALRQLLPHKHIPATEPVVPVLELLDTEWEAITHDTIDRPRRSVSSGGISLNGAQKSRWTPAASRSPPLTRQQEIEARTASLKASHETLGALRACLVATSAQSVTKWSRGRFEILLTDIADVLQVLEECGGFDRGEAQRQVDLLVQDFKNAL